VRVACYAPILAEITSLCRIYGQTPEELGLLRKDQNAIVLPRVAPAVGPDMVQYFRNVFTEHLLADNLMGPHHLVDVVRAQTTLLDQMLPNARGDVRQDLLMLAFRYNEFAGWLYQDACNPDQAMRYTDRSMEYAMEIGESRERAYVLMRKADIAADLDHPDRVIGLTQAALRNPAQVVPQVKALVLRLRGRAYARLGNAGECARALDSAYEEVLRPSDGPDGLTDYCTPSYIGMEAANCWSKLGRFDAAITAYRRSLPNWPDALRRDHGLCLARLSTAYAGQGDIEGACTAGRQAVDVVRSATSSRALSELQRVRVRLAPMRRHAEVSDLSDRIRGLIQPAA
jgi:tetratricopeptide (TPR) repeat protein